MSEEREPFLAAADTVGAINSRFAGTRELTSVTIAGVPGEILVTGIGPAAAASALGAYLATRTTVQRIVSVGSAGGLHPSVEVGSVIVGTHYRYADVDARAFGYEFGQVPGMPAEFLSGALPEEVSTAAFVHEGLLLTSSSFVSAELARPIQEQFPEALAVDMESAALVQTCHLFGHAGFISVRGISDLCTPAAGQDFHDGLGLAAVRSQEITRLLLASA